MPYYARKHQLQNSLIYHVYNRSNAKEKIFHSADDFRCFKEIICEYADKFKIKIYHWVIMPNHYHLLLEIAEPELISKYMAGINRAYTHHYHRNYETVGFLWQGRFKLQPVQKEKYLFACGRYIERNPVKALIVAQAEDYFYSSARFYCLGESDGITSANPEYAQFGINIGERQQAYKKFLQDFNQEDEIPFDNLEEPKGDKEFVRRLQKIHGRYLPKRRGRLTKRFVT